MCEDYFYANVCHVCKKTARSGTILTKCRKCNMISYCSEKHKLKDKENHGDLCSAIRHYRILCNRKGIPISTMEIPNMWQWMRCKYQFMTAVQQILKRPLLRFEKQMFMFPSSCLACHKQNDLQHCSKCASVNFCHAHLDNIEHLSIVCEMLRKSYTIDIYNTLTNGIWPVDMNYLKHLPNDRYVDLSAYKLGVSDFYLMHIRPYIEVNIETFVQSLIQANYHTEKVSDPLTLLFAMQLLKYTDFGESLDIYVITNEFLDAASLHGWEILLHLIPRLINLRIVSIGPKLKYHCLTDCDYLCEKCILCKKKLSYASAVYTREMIEIHKPHLIVSFNARIYEGKAKHINLKTYDYTSDINNWKDILQCLTDLRVGPVILPCYNKFEAIENMSAINNILNKEQRNVVEARNFFINLKACRDPETETILIRNDYLIAYSSFSRDE